MRAPLPGLSPTPRSTPRRHPERTRTERRELYDILDEALVCHLGVVVDGAPVVLPTGFGRIGDVLYVHGSVASRILAAAAGSPVSVAVTLLDGIVYARAVFRCSANYRSAVVHGVGRRVTDPEEVRSALRAITEHLAPGTWAYGRTPSRREVAATAVVALDLTEAAVKVRTGPPRDSADDVAGGRWGGVLPVRTVFGEPSPRAGVPAHVVRR